MDVCLHYMHIVMYYNIYPYVLVRNMLKISDMHGKSIEYNI